MQKRKPRAPQRKVRFDHLRLNLLFDLELRVVCERNSGYLAAAARWPGRPVTGLGADAGYWGAARSPKEIQEAIEWANSMAFGMGRGRKGCNAAKNRRARNPMVTPDFGHICILEAKGRYAPHPAARC